MHDHRDFPDPNRLVDYDPNAPNILRFLKPFSLIKGIGHIASDYLLTPAINAGIEVGHKLSLLRQQN